MSQRRRTLRVCLLVALRCVVVRIHGVVLLVRLCAALCLALKRLASVGPSRIDLVRVSCLGSVSTTCQFLPAGTARPRPPTLTTTRKTILWTRTPSSLPALRACRPLILPWCDESDDAAREERHCGWRLWRRTHRGRPPGTISVADKYVRVRTRTLWWQVELTVDRIHLSLSHSEYPKMASHLAHI